ncbi:acyltransferase family-domain-containing protein [Exophiala viscosa]|uniref:acyltransferase family-domain-containing protein n=1 Tax=Exophiala viscosa TaxID=2486360 RepID=UPI002195FBD9|nr:acyltransferase family-domain-containing protein [Exophiala viscosa]
MQQSQPLLTEEDGRDIETSEVNAEIDYDLWQKDMGTPLRRSRIHGLLQSYHNTKHYIQDNILTRRVLISILPHYLQPGGLKAPPNLRSTAYLDALRGYAAWVVVNHHFYWTNHYLKLPLIDIVHSGRAMVDIFFIISGYVLSHNLLQKIREKKEQNLLKSLASSTFRRYIRLYFSAGFAALVSMLLTCVGLLKYPLVAWKGSFFVQLADWVKDMLRFSNPFADVKGYYYGEHTQNSRYHPYLWTIPAEFRGSMVVFVFCLACCKLSTRHRTIACWLLITLCYLWDAAYVALFMFGVHLAERSLNKPAPQTSSPSPEMEQLQVEIGAHAEKIRWRRSRLATGGRYLVAIIALVVGVFLCSQPHNLGKKGPNPWPVLSKAVPSWWHGGDQGREHFWLSIAAALIVWALETCPPLQRPFNWGFSQYVGKLSFGLYVMHLLVVRSFWDGPLNQLRSWLGNGQKSYCFTYVIFMLLVFWAADYFIRVDRHIIAFGRWLERKTFT